MWTTYYSHGKLLLSGEYTILDGAIGLAIPTQFGQSLKFRTTDTGILKWTSYDEQNKSWFKQNFDLKTFQLVQPEVAQKVPDSVSAKLSEILRYCRELNPDFLKEDNGVEVETLLEFNRNWGLGSSSTLINNIAQWAQVDPFILQNKIFGGSGYDIACAIHHTPIFYQLRGSKPLVSPASFDPAFRDKLYFVYLKRKQDSRKAIESYRKLKVSKAVLISRITELSSQLTTAETLIEFMELLREHEYLMSEALQFPMIQKSHFPDFPGVVKSLGAWGGDFILAAGGENDIPEYFYSKGFNTVIPYEEMILIS